MSITAPAAPAATPAGERRTATTVDDDRRRSEARRGALDMLPMLLGYAPFALIVGSAVADSAHPAAGWAGIWLILGGSAHLATLRALGDGTAALAILTGLLVNSRLLLYSTSLRTPWAGQPRWFRLVAGALLIDPTWAAAQRRAAVPGTDSDHRAYYLGSAVVLSVGWCVMITFGMIVGGGWAAGLGMEVALPLCLATLVAPRLRDRSMRVTVLVAATAALVTSSWPAGTGMLVAVGAGAVIGARPRPDSTTAA